MGYPHQLEVGSADSAPIPAVLAETLWVRAASTRNPRSR